MFVEHTITAASASPVVVVDTAGRLLGIVYGDLTGLQLLLQEIRIFKHGR